MGNDISNNLKLFADDTLLYGLVCNNDAIRLQEDLDKLVLWGHTWQMEFHLSKCYVLRLHKTKNTTIYPYSMLCQTLKDVDHTSYLGITLTEILNWNIHTNNIENKANKTFGGFVKRRLFKCPQVVKSQAYKSLVRPTMVYGSSVWDPYMEYQKAALEKVQRRTARFVTNTYGRETGCVTKALKILKWETLEERRKVARLTLLHRTLNNQVAVSVPEYLKPQSCLKTKFSHPNKFVPLQPRSDTYKFSFWSRTIRDFTSLHFTFSFICSTVTYILFFTYSCNL